MGVTLDELLESSGISSLKGEAEEKTASASDAQVDEGNLVTALRKFASDGESDQREIRQEAARELAEKTAEIMVITKTIDEINKLASLGVEEEQMQKVATFIKVALDKGHSSEDIARFLEKNAAASRIGRAISAAAQAVRRPFARSAARYSAKAVQAEERILRDKLIHGSKAEIEKHLRHLEGKIGRPALTKYLQKIQQEGTRLHPSAFSYIPRPPRGGKALATIKTRGGKEYSVGEGTARSAGIGALGLGTGYALTKKDSDKGGRGGAVIVTR